MTNSITTAIRNELNLNNLVLESIYDSLDNRGVALGDEAKFDDDTINLIKLSNRQLKSQLSRSYDILMPKSKY